MQNLKKFIKSFNKKQTLLLSLSGVALILLFILLCLLLYPRLTKEEMGEGAPEFLFSISSEKNNLKALLGVAVQDDKVYITDSENGKILIFSEEGKLVSSFPVGDEKKPYPVGIVKVDDKIYVSELGSGKILVFEENGRLLKKFASDVLLKPTALYFFDNKLYVTDIGDHTVKVFDLKGKLLLKFGSWGDKNGAFSYPNAVATNGKRIFVSDSNNRRVQVFNEKGKFLEIFDYSFQLPRGIAIDSLGRVHVVDTLSYSVCVFNKEGDFLFEYGGFDNGECYLPNGVAIDGSLARIYVTNRNGTISVFSYEK